MTEEQIEQRAKRYAETYVSKTAAYIGGAHSRDEEIKELEEKLKYADESIADADKWIAKYKLELDQLRNPWISVKDRLPDDNKTVLLWFGGYYAVAVMRNGKWWHCTGWQTDGGWSALDEISDIATMYITHWMPIPDTQLELL